MLALGRLLRVSLSPSAAADAACGVLLGAGAWPQGAGPWLQILAALCVYHGGMALNDWADREHDAATRPDRPLPSAQLSPALALVLGLGLSFLGPVLALQISPAAGAALALVAVLAVTYNLGIRGPRAGPLLLGACRAGNLGTAMLAGRSLAPESGGLEAWMILAAALYGLYVFLLSCLARYEDSEAGPVPPDSAWNHPRRWLVAAAVVLCVTPLARLFEDEPRPARLYVLGALLLSGLSARGLYLRSRNVQSWSPGAIMGSMGMGLRRLLVVTGALALTSGAPHGVLVSAVILLGYPASYALRRAFPPS